MMMGTGKYMLDENGVPVATENLVEWAEWYEKAQPQRSNLLKVARTSVDAFTVSTVFLGLDFQHGDGPPLIYETMVLGLPRTDSIIRRYSTKAEALTGHEQIVLGLKEQQATPTGGA